MSESSAYYGRSRRAADGQAEAPVGATVAAGAAR